MGWTFTQRRKGEGTLAFFGRELDWQRGGASGEVIAAKSPSFGETYLAYRSREADGSERVSAIVCPSTWRRNATLNFGYKDISEEMHPYYYACPGSILALLTPTASESANRWRTTCREQMEKRKSVPKLRPGLVLRLAEPLAGYTDLTVVNPRNLVFEAPGGSRYRLRWQHLLGATAL